MKYFQKLQSGPHHGIVAIIGGFLPCFSQVSFELLNRLVEGSIIAETLRLEQAL
jgi:hypothetical protein